MLCGDYYDHWVKSLCYNLLSKNKLGFLNDTITQLDVESADFSQWGVFNSMLVAWSFNTLDEKIRVDCKQRGHWVSVYYGKLSTLYIG